MTDLKIFPESQTEAPIVQEQVLKNGWKICLLQNGSFVYFDCAQNLFKINEESFKWNLYWNARTANQEENAIARFAESRNSLDPLLIETMLQFINKHKQQVV